MQALATAPEGARFALAAALGAVGGPDSLPALLALLEDPFARAEAAEAASRVAQRHGGGPRVIEALGEAGLGAAWRWAPRARLGDERWAEALRREWPGLAQAARIQALEAACLLPEELRAGIRAAVVEECRRVGGRLGEAAESL